jgi:hypothetical protein
MNASSFRAAARCLIGPERLVRWSLLSLLFLGACATPQSTLPPQPWGEQHAFACHETSRCMMQAHDRCRGKFTVLDKQFSRELIGRDPLERRVLTRLVVECDTPLERSTRQLQVSEDLRHQTL